MCNQQINYITTKFHLPSVQGFPFCLRYFKRISHRPIARFDFDTCICWNITDLFELSLQTSALYILNVYFSSNSLCCILGHYSFPLAFVPFKNGIGLSWSVFYNRPTFGAIERNITNDIALNFRFETTNTYCGTLLHP